MAAAECGPSNGLQRFKQHTDIDRTLQQDRLAARNHPAQGFRSANPNAGLLDPEFEAFQDGVDLPLHDQSPFQQPASFGGPSQVPSWAADFQRMSISQPPPLQQQHFNPQPSTANWAQGFQQPIAQAAPRQQGSSPAPQAFQQRARYGLTGFQSQFAQPSYATPTHKSKGKAPIQVEQFDDAAFAAAFDQAHEDLMADAAEAEETEQEQEQVPSAQELLDELEAEKFEAAVEEAAMHILKEDGHDLDIEEMHPMASMHGADIEYDTMQAPIEDRQEQINQINDNDALAATAEELLEKVKHNQSDKFKNSQFLALMRRLKDREVKVEGDKMVETTDTTSAQTADATLNASSINIEHNIHDAMQHSTFPVDTRPPDYGIPHAEQDHDMGRIDPRDGQEVVDLLNARGLVTDDMAANGSTSLSDMLYGQKGTLNFSSFTP
ncbi:hypothetical protein CERZMDRAFT_82650 [Cercospora zeae-maydis SCOH1-5]|uniref:Peroxin 20 n=1 Tax=Cercospora zeae-maydis SCOH1-5 TaxID=717836 RepID=A0A6A6FMT4_9PEZI|nr:hypothetical protein CERZMDRAFT_82650 [Cercospora zeae-maydis SCOH1-5]